MIDFKAAFARSKMQEEAKTAIRKANYNAAILASVGSGKGKIMVDLAQELLDKGLISTVLYLCDSTRLRDDTAGGFPNELSKWGSPKLISATTLECYQTAYKFRNHKWGLVLGDEIDFALTEAYIKVFFNNQFKYRIVVTGTLTDEKKVLLEKLVPLVYKISTTDAEEAEIINKTQYLVYNYTMNDEESFLYNKWTRALAKAMAEEKPRATQMYLATKRKSLLVNMKSGVEACDKVCRWLYNQDKNTRCVIFCEQTSQADRVCKYSYHGKNEGKDNLAKFQKGLINWISVVSKVRRGINLIRATAGIFESLSSSTTEFDQRNGRLKRLKVNELATIVFLVAWVKKKDSDGNIYYKETIMADWVRKATANINDRLKDLVL